jgi:hypothetical protein
MLMLTLHDFGTGQDGVEESDTEEQEEAVEEQELEDDRSVRAVRRSGRRRKTTPRLVVDHDNSRAYGVEAGVLHVNRSILQKAQRDLKIAPNKMGPEPDRGLRLMLAKPAGIGQKALDTLMNGKLLVRDETVSNGMVLHAVGVILAQQYSMNNGFQLFGDRARESVSCEQGIAATA